MAMSADGWAGRPQLRKFVLFAVLLVTVSTVRRIEHAKWLLVGIVAVALVSSGLSFVQFADRIREARAAGMDFYTYYTPKRTTGFMSHWMTFSGEVLTAFLVAGAFTLFEKKSRWGTVLGLAATAVLAAALVLNQTRGIWLAAGAGAVYLLAVWRPRWLLALPVLAVLLYLAAPGAVQQRVLSMAKPHGTTDSNQHRIVCWRTGWEMAKANPLFGVGPEQVGPQFLQYVPADLGRPLPEGWYGHVHNVFLQYAAERGFPALALLLWLLGRMAWDWRRALASADAGRRFVLHSALAVWVGVVVSGLFEHNLGNSEVLHVFLAVAAAGYVATMASPETVGAGV